jgi:hypothetical protein
MRSPLDRGPIVVLLVTVVMTGSCATQTLSQRDANAMSSLTLHEFLTERFGKRSAGNSLLVSMTNGLAKATAATDAYSTTPGSYTKEDAQREERRSQLVRPDGSFVHNALYDRTHLEQVLRPVNELRAFCQAQGGQFNIVNPYDPDEIDTVFQRRTVARVAEGLQKDANVKAVLGEDTRIYTLQGAGQSASLDRDEDRAGAVDGYRAAAGRPAFGDATCAGSNARANWKVNLRPVYFEPYNPKSSIKMHELDIRIAEGESARGGTPNMETKIEGVR